MSKNKVTREEVVAFLRDEIEMWGEANALNGHTGESFRNGFRAGIVHGLYAALHEVENGAL